MKMVRALVVFIALSLTGRVDAVQRAVIAHTGLSSLHVRNRTTLMRKSLSVTQLKAKHESVVPGDAGQWYTVHTLPTVHTPLVFFGPFSGKLPPVFPMTIASMRANVDCCTFVAFHMGNEDPADAVSVIRTAGERPSNFHFVHANESQFEKEFAQRVGRPVNAKMLTGRQLGRNHKWNDVRIASPLFFAEKIGPEVQFWGFLEHDLTYGMLSPLVNFVGRNFDLWTGLNSPNGSPDRVSAPLFLMRTGEVTHKMLNGIIQTKENPFLDAHWQWLDEIGISQAALDHPEVRHSFHYYDKVPENFEPHDVCYVRENGRCEWSPSTGVFCGSQRATSFACHFTHFVGDAVDKNLKRISDQELQSLLNHGWIFDVETGFSKTGQMSTPGLANYDSKKQLF